MKGGCVCETERGKEKIIGKDRSFRSVVPDVHSGKGGVGDIPLAKGLTGKMCARSVYRRISQTYTEN